MINNLLFFSFFHCVFNQNTFFFFLFSFFCFLCFLSFLFFSTFFFSFPLNTGTRHLQRATGNPVGHRPKSAAAAKVANEQSTLQRSKAPKRGPFAIKVFFLGSSSPPCELVVTGTDTMEIVKQKIEFQQGIPAERLHLFVGRKQIGEGSSKGKKKGPTVGSIGLKPGQELSVALG